METTLLNQTLSRDRDGSQRPGKVWTPLLAVGAGASAVGQDVCHKRLVGSLRIGSIVDHSLDCLKGS